MDRKDGRKIVMNELERLKAERKRIDKRIKELTLERKEYKRWSIRPVHGYGSRYKGLHFSTCSINGQKAMQKCIFHSTDEQSIKEEIPSIIEELQGLYELVTKDERN